MLSVLLQDESRYQAQTLWSCKLEKKPFSFLRHWFIMRMREENAKWWRGRQTTRDVTTTWTRRQASCRTLQAESIHHTLQFSLLRRRADSPGEFEKSLRLVSSRDATSVQSVKYFENVHSASIIHFSAVEDDAFSAESALYEWSL